MKKNIFAICDLEVEYACRFMDYMNAKKSLPFEVQVFTTVRNLLLFTKDHKTEFLLISSRAMCEEVKQANIEKIMILSEGELLKDLIEYPCIYKYQSSESIMAEVMNYYAEQDTKEGPVHLLKKKMEIIGIYSPIKRNLKTSFALTLGQILARNRAVLYMNLEGFSGFETLMEKEFATDLSDLMYFVRQKAGNILFKLNGMTHQLNNMDYIPPPFSPFDIKSVQFEEWVELLNQIFSFSSYEIIILDLGEMADQLFEILRLCTKIYMPVREDGISLSKLEQYEKLLKLGEYEDVLEKTKKIKLPFHNSFGTRESYVEQLMWGELGDYVKKLLEEEEKNENRNSV